MTIHFSNSNFSEFEDALRRINPGVNAQETLSAVDCIRIYQESDSVTFLQTVEPDRAGFERKIHHDMTGAEGGGGITGTSFLVYIPDLVNKLNRLGKSSTKGLTLQHSERGLRLRKNLRYENGREIDEGILLSRLYSGASSDFKSIEPVSRETGWTDFVGQDKDDDDDDVETLEPQKILDIDTSINRDRFKIWVALLMDFGEFGTERRPEGTALSRTVAITYSSTANQLIGLTNCKGAHMAYLQVSQTLQEEQTDQGTDSDIVFAIEGRHMKKLENLAKNDELITICSGTADDCRWLTVSGDVGRTTLKAGEPLRNFLLDAKLFGNEETIQVNGKSFNLLFHASRNMNLADLQAAVSMQQPTKTERLTGASLLLIESDNSLVITQATDLAGQERSNVFWDITSQEGEWEPLSVNGDALEAGLDIFKKYFGYIRTGSTSVVKLIQKKFVRPDNSVSWNLYINSIDDHTAEVLIFSHAVDTVADFIDSRD